MVFPHHRGNLLFQEAAMSAKVRPILATLFLTLPWISAQAGELRCTSVNGNLNCAGSGAVSCQTINGHTVCTNGDAVQSFGAPDNDQADDPDDDTPAIPPHGSRWQRGF
jgi:hypothetical protein